MTGRNLFALTNLNVFAEQRISVRYKKNRKMDAKSGKESRLKKLKNFITVEPVVFAVTIPYCLLVICLQNLTLEKVTICV